MRAHGKKIAAIAFLGFLCLFALGVVRDGSQPYPPPLAVHLSSVADELSRSRLPIANNLRQIGLAQTPLPLVLD